MRFLLAIGLTLAAMSGFAQQPQAVSGLFASVRPDISIAVKKHDLGADLVEVTILNPKYPPELLKERLNQLGTLLGSGARGVVAGPYSMGAAGDANMTFVKGSCAVDGLVDETNHRLKIQEILRAFVGDPEPFKLSGFTIFFDSLKPNDRYVRSFNAGPVKAEARMQGQPAPGLEYRILVETNDPKEVEFPEYAPERKVAPPPSQPASSSPVMTWVAIGVAALAAGALVYLALLWAGSKSKSGKR